MPELGQTTDLKALIPGEPGEIRKSTVHLTTYGDTMRQIGDGLKRLDTGGWTGKAADAFHRRFQDEPQRWLDAGDAFHAAAPAINSYANTLEWAQDQAGEAIRLWQQGEQTTAQAKAQHDQATTAAAQHTAANGQPPPAEQPFQDPGEATREQARQTLNRARTQLDSAGYEAVCAVDRAQEHAPQEPTFLDDIGNAFTSAADWTGYQVDEGLHSLGGTVAKAVDNIGYLPTDIVDLTTHAAGGIVDDAGQMIGGILDNLGDATGIHALNQVGHTVTSSLHDADQAIVHAGDVAEDTIHKGFRDAGATVSGWIGDLGDDISGHDPGPRGPQRIVIDENKYPESAEHIEEAQSGTIWRGRSVDDNGTPLPSEVTVDRPGADFNRREALNGIPGRGGERLDRDEYPPAMFEEGGDGASVKYISASDNRGAGASMGNQARTFGLDNGDKVRIDVG
jgi:hypothetical protein